MVEQIAWSGASPPAKTLRFPSRTEERFMAYQAIIHGARGLMFFGGNVASTLNAQDAPLGWNWTFWENVLKPVVKEIGDNSLLADALVVPNSVLPVQVTTNSGIEFCVREVSPYLYILACNRQSAVTTNVVFTGLPATAGLGELLYESPRTVTATNGMFSDWFAPNEVHAYRFALTNVPSIIPVTLYEPFDYPNVGEPVSSNAPASWSFGGTGTNDLKVTAGSLVFPGFAPSVGNSVTNGGAGLGVRRLFGTNINSGQIYFSALFRINELGYGTWSGAGAQVGALTAPDGTSFRLAVMVKSNSPGGYVIGLQKGGTGASTVYDTIEHAVGETLLLVGKYDFTVSSNAVSLWINPTSTSFMSSQEPTNGFLYNNTGSDGFTIDRFNFRQNTAASVPAAMQWDELRIGFSWAEVTPVTSAASSSPVTLNNVVQGSDGTFQFYYSDNTYPTFMVYGSTNLIDWAPLSNATAIAPSVYQFTDRESTNHVRRFYQLRR
jgi:hypothetical protein